MSGSWFDPPGGSATRVGDSDRILIEQEGVSRTITRQLLLKGLRLGAFFHGDTEPPSDTLGRAGDFYLCTADPLNLYGPKTIDETWPAPPATLRGPQSPPMFDGVGDPTGQSIVAAVGEHYLNYENGDLWRKSAMPDTWAFQFNIIGSKFQNGTGNPNGRGLLARQGLDYYIDGASGDVWKKTAEPDTWVIQCNIGGAQGPIGPGTSGFELVSSYASLTAAVAALGAVGNHTLVLDVPTALTADTVTNKNLAIIGTAKGIVSTAGHNLTFYGSFSAGRFSVFDQTGWGGVFFAQGALNGRVSAAWFGVLSDGVNDDTAALLRAQAASVLPNITGSGFYYDVDIYVGKTMIHEFAWNNKTTFFGEQVGFSKIIYNGAGGAGSYLIGMSAGGGAVPFSGFLNLSLYGYDDNNPAGMIAENLIKNLGVGYDWGFKLDNIQFAECFGDALNLINGTNTTPNLHIGRVRFDAVGGFGVALKSNSTNSGAPVTIQRFTLDNNISGAFATRAAALGYYDGTRWGKGLMDVEDGQGLHFTITDTRIELNKKLIPYGGVTSLIYSNNTLGGSSTSFYLRNVTGTGRSDQSIILVKDTTGRTNYRGERVTISSIGKQFEEPTGAREVYRGSPGYNLSEYNSQQQVGMTLSGRTVEFRSTPPNLAASVAAWYTKGSLCHNTAAVAGSASGWKCISPATGAGQGGVNQLTNAAIASIGNPVVPVPSSRLTYFFTGANITILGAGVAGADLTTTVLSVDEAANTITVASAPATGVSPATINSVAAVWAPLGWVPGVSKPGNADCTLQPNTATPTQIFSTPLTANRTVTLGTSTSLPFTGIRFRIVRTAAASGAFNLLIGPGLKILAAGQWCDVEWDGGAWNLVAFGSL